MRLLTVTKQIVNFQIFNKFQLQVLTFAAFALLTAAEDDGKYRPLERTYRPIVEATTTTTAAPRLFPTTTKVPVYTYNDPRYEWNARRYWPRDQYDSRYDDPRYDTRFNVNGEISRHENETSF